VRILIAKALKLYSIKEQGHNMPHTDKAGAVVCCGYLVLSGNEENVLSAFRKCR